MPEPRRIKLLNKHNSGAYGEVWIGEQTDLHRKVAVKVIKVEFADKASAKAHALALASLNHPCIVTVYSLEMVELPDGQIVDAIVMELLEGETLGERLRRGNIEKEELFKIMDSMIQGLRYMHGKNIYHGDLHPGNIIIGDSFVKIIDLSASDQRSISRFSTMTKDTLVAVDVASIACNLRFSINRCTTDFVRLYVETQKLTCVQSIDEVDAILQKLKAFDAEHDVDEDEDTPKGIFGSLGYTELDALVLKVCGDKVVNGRDVSEVLSCPDIVLQLIDEGQKESEIFDALEILGQQGVFREGDVRFKRFVQMSNYGVDIYLQAYYSEYEKTFRAVKIAIVKDGVMTDREIAAHLGKEKPIIQHFMNKLESDFNCTISKSNMGYQVIEIGASLRRDLK